MAVDDAENMPNLLRDDAIATVRCVNCIVTCGWWKWKLVSSLTFFSSWGWAFDPLCLVCGDWVILLRFLNHLWRLIRIMHLLWWRVRRAPSRNTVGPMSIAFWRVNRTTFTLCTCRILSIYINYNKRSLLVLLLNYWLLLIFNWFKHSNAIYGVQELRSK